MTSQSIVEILEPVVQTYSILAITLAAGESTLVNPAIMSRATAHSLDFQVTPPGTNLSTSPVTLPALLQSPSVSIAKQWKTLFDHGITPVDSLTMTPAIGFAALVYHTTLTPGLTVTGAMSY